MMPVWFFLSSIAAGLGLVIMVEMWIAKAWHRKLRTAQLAALGKLAFWALLVFEGVRVGDLAVRGQLAAALASPRAWQLTVELLLGGLIPLVLLSTRKLRENPTTLFLGALLACGGVVLNRCNIVMFSLDMKGPIPQFAPQSYAPSAVEWGLSVGLIAATIFLFGWAVRHMPILPKEDHASPA